RVHIVSEPPTDYIRFLLTWAYPANADAGEDVRVLPRRIAETLDLPGQDYWLLDARRVALMGYDGNGNWLSVDLIDEPHIVASYIAGRDAALKHSIPLNAYLELLLRNAESAGAWTATTSTHSPPVPSL